MSDRHLLRRLLRNLVSNAIKYTLEGRVVVGVRRSGDRARIEVWDTGIGIPRARREDIFLEFERLPNAVAVAPGVGLGLSIVRRLGHVLGHEIHVRSKPGRGSVFAVVARRASRLGAGAPSSLSDFVIAAITNDPGASTELERLLEGWACTVVAAPDTAGVEVKLCAMGLAPDAIILDGDRASEDPFAIIARMRATHHACQALLITADRRPALRDRARRAEIGLIAKPARPAALRALLTRWRFVKQAAE